MSDSTAIVPKISSADVVEVESDAVPNLAGAVTQLQNTLAAIHPTKNPTAVEAALAITNDSAEERRRVPPSEHGHGPGDRRELL
jgi:hypothetical protein